jgi:hypothetical protein
MAEYFTSDFEHPMSEDALREADADIQRDVLLTWFRQRFEDPAQRTPYNSEEGGYLWIHGGPYDAREELEQEFSEIVPAEVIEEVVDELETECDAWAPTPRPDDYDDHDGLVAEIGTITGFYHNFTDAILDIERLLATKVEDSVALCFRRLLYVNVITALETYLSDAFNSTVLNDPALMRRFIETTPDFKAQKVTYSEIFKAAEEAKQKARTYLVDVVWHHIERIKPMYRETLGISFPDDAGAIFRAVLTRHDIVHRNGKTKDGKEIVLNAESVTKLIETAEGFVQHIDNQLAARKVAPRDVPLDTLSVDAPAPTTRGN